jgi:SAM-dependent methyltransferase
MTDVAEHVAGLPLLFSEVARVLAPEGHLILGVPFLFPVHEAPFDYWRMTDSGLRYLCDSASLEIVSVKAYGGYIAVLLGLLGSLRCWPTAWVCRGYLRVAKLRMGRVIGTAGQSTFPLGYVAVAAKRRS